MFRKGNYKLVKMNDGEWELYDMINDPTELVDLAKIKPDKTKELINSYNKVYNKIYMN
jgi:arylsulfatase